MLPIIRALNKIDMRLDRQIDALTGLAASIQNSIDVILLAQGEIGDVRREINNECASDSAPDPLAGWVKEELEMTGSASRPDLLTSFNRWADRAGMEPLGPRAFFPRLRALVPELGDMQRNDGVRVILGVRLRTPIEAEA